MWASLTSFSCLTTRLKHIETKKKRSGFTLVKWLNCAIKARFQEIIFAMWTTLDYIYGAQDVWGPSAAFPQWPQCVSTPTLINKCGLSKQRGNCGLQDMDQFTGLLEINTVYFTALLQFSTVIHREIKPRPLLDAGGSEKSLGGKKQIRNVVLKFLFYVLPEV